MRECGELADKLRKIELNGVHYIYIAASCDNSDSNKHFQNVERAIQAGYDVMQKGYVPFIPHVVVGAFSELSVPRKYLLLLDLMWMVRCDAVLYLNPITKGVDQELKVARALDIPVFGFIHELPKSGDLDKVQHLIME